MNSCITAATSAWMLLDERFIRYWLHRGSLCSLDSALASHKNLAARSDQVFHCLARPAIDSRGLALLEAVHNHVAAIRIIYVVFTVLDSARLSMQFVE
jgi:hypothetical protein